MLSDIIDGSSVSLCGTDGVGYDYTSSGSILTIAFHTDLSITFSGFSLFYEAVDAPAHPATGNMKNINDNRSVWYMEISLYSIIH